MVLPLTVKLVGAFASVMMQAGPAAAAGPPPGTARPVASPGAAPPPAAPSTAALLEDAADKARPVLDLEAAERTAIQNQPNLRQARYATAAAAGRVEEARSGYLPQVVASAQVTYGDLATHVQGVGAVPSTTASIGGIAWSPNGLGYNAQVNATQLIYDFGQTSEKWRSADRSVEALQATEVVTRNQALFSVRSAFFTARADRALIGVQRDTLANIEKHLTQTKGFVRAGTQPEIALAQTLTDLANAKVQLIQAENNYDTARAQLNQAMGVTTIVDYDVADEGIGTVDGEDTSSDKLIARALAARPELASLAKQHEADVLTIRSIKGAYAPTISGLAGVGVFGSPVALETATTTAVGTSQYAGWDIGVGLTWPLFQGGLTKGQVHEAEGNLGVVDAQLEAERLQVRFDVEQARLALRTAKVSISAAEEALVNAKEQLRLADASYTQGVGNIIQLGDAQVAETSAAAQRVQADFNLAIARSQLLLALGHP
jgi:outer membrane protein